MRRRSGTLTAEQMQLAGLLADTDLTHAQLAEHLRVPFKTLLTRVAALYMKLGLTGGRAALREHLLACELAAVE